MRLARLEHLGTAKRLLSDSLPVIKCRVEDVMEQQNEDKQQISALLLTIIFWLKDVITTSTENKVHIKRVRPNDAAGTDAFVDDFMHRADLGGNTAQAWPHTPHNELEDYIDLLSSKVAVLG
eukprot:9819387-Ditylum_brightwellii.AAC.1